MSSSGPYSRYTAPSHNSNPYGQSYSSSAGYGGGYGVGPAPGYGGTGSSSYAAPSSGNYEQVCYIDSYA